MRNDVQQDGSSSPSREDWQERPLAAGDGWDDMLDVQPTAEAIAVTEGLAVEALHDLNNALVSILLNAQVIGMKLPSYSRLRRNVHEVERSAQRSAVVVKRLENWLQTEAKCKCDSKAPANKRRGSGAETTIVDESFHPCNDSVKTQEGDGTTARK
ncbi:MAG TPA: hypothetical protein VMU28_15130 [Terriglobales bacterium]|nr:hypothetical protein [Terriglobales bacterium]